MNSFLTCKFHVSHAISFLTCKFSLHNFTKTIKKLLAQTLTHFFEILSQILTKSSLNFSSVRPFVFLTFASLCLKILFNKFKFCNAPVSFKKKKKIKEKKRNELSLKHICFFVEFSVVRNSL